MPGETREQPRIAAGTLPTRRKPHGSGAFARHDRRAYLWVKRGVDVLLSLAALQLLSPLLLLIALMIKLDSSGPVLFSQERAGYNWRTRAHRTFSMYKFRSMLRNCDQSVHQQLVRDWIHCRNGASGSSDHAELVKLTGDRRVTRIGKILRRTSLDELPQLWNVLKGDMSLVGPRPVPLYEVAEYETWHRRRLDATPGITGLWQVMGRGVVNIDEMVRLDIQYIERQSFWLDLKILVLTIPAVFSARGAA